MSREASIEALLALCVEKLLPLIPPVPERHTVCGLP